MKKLVLFVCMMSLFVQSITLMKATSEEIERINAYQDLDDIEKTVESKPLQDIPFTKNNTLPQRYDARDDHLVTSVKDQGNLGICWAYTVASVAETQYLKKGYANNPSEVDFNELQMAYGFYHRINDPLQLTANDTVTSFGSGDANDYLLVGGNHMLSSFYLAQWSSMVNEADFPNVNRVNQIPDNLNELYSYDKASFVMQDALFLPDDDVDAIKNAIYQYGSVATAYFSNEEYYHPYIFHDDTNMGVNHSVTLVGWDDSISKGSFADSNEDGLLPSRDGAWIMKNSWSEYAGEDGYFYLSYDMHLDTTTAFLFEKREQYDHNYFYDGGYGIIYDNPYGMANLKVGNIFQAQKASSTNQERLEAVSIAVASSNTNYSIQIYQLDDDYSSPVDGQLLTSKPITGSLQYPGAYTIELDSPISLKENGYFSVVVTLSGENPTIYTSKDYSYTGFLSGTDKGERNQSFVSYGFGWSDFYELRESVPRIRAYTNDFRESEVRNQIQALIQIIENYQQSDDYTLLVDAYTTNLTNAYEIAQNTVLDFGLSDEQYQEVYDQLLIAYEEVQNKVKEIKQIKNQLQNKADECLQWLQKEEAQILSEAKKEQFTRVLNESFEFLQETLSLEEWQQQLDTLTSAYDEMKDYILAQKEVREVLWDYLERLNMIFTYEIDYVQNETKQNADIIYNEGYIVYQTNDDAQYEQKIIQLEEQIERLESEIQDSKFAQLSLLELYKEANSFLEKESSYLTIEEKEDFQQKLVEINEVSRQMYEAEIYNESAQSFNSVYQDLQTKVVVRKQEEQLQYEQALQQLLQAISTYEQYALHLYTNESVAIYQEAYEEAKVLYENKEATIEEILAMVSQLEESRMNLVLAKPQAVQNVKAMDVNYKTIQLQWDEVEGATSYDIYRKSYKEGSIFELEATVEEPTYESVGVMTGKEYAFYVVAKNEAGESEASEEVVMATSLKGDITLAMEQVSTSKFHLRWNKVDGATRYIVYRKRNDDKMKKVLTLGGDVLEYTTAEMPHGEYQFQVKAGRYDSVDRVMTGASNKVSGMVEEIKPTTTLTSGSKQIKVSWVKLEGVTHYEVYRATSSKGTYTKLATTKELSYTAKSLTKGKKYYFKVKGYKLYKSGTDIQYKVYTPYSSVKSMIVK